MDKNAPPGHAGGNVPYGPNKTGSRIADPTGERSAASHGSRMADPTGERGAASHGSRMADPTGDRSAASHGSRMADPTGERSAASHASRMADLGDGNASTGTSRGSASREGASQAATSVVSEAKEAARSAGEAVQKQASKFAADIGHEMRITAEGQKMRGVEAIQCFARAIGCAAEELEHQSPAVAQSVRAAARTVEGLSNNISNRNVEELLGAATELARSQPTLFIGGAVAVGFALSRFLKSSARRHASHNTPWPHQDAPLQPSMSGQRLTETRHVAP